jgi:hypothetical protein
MLLYSVVTWGLQRATDPRGFIVEGTYEEVLGVWKRTEALIADERARGTRIAIDPDDRDFYDRFRGRTGPKIKTARTVSDNFKYLVALSATSGAGDEAIGIDFSQVRERDETSPPLFRVVTRRLDAPIGQLPRRRLPAIARPLASQEDLVVAASLVHVAATLGARTGRPHLAGRLAEFLNAEFEQQLEGEGRSALEVRSYLKENDARRRASATAFSPIDHWASFPVGRVQKIFMKLEPELRTFEKRWRTAVRYTEAAAEAQALFEAGQDIRAPYATRWSALDETFNTFIGGIHSVCIPLSFDVASNGRERFLSALHQFVHERVPDEANESFFVGFYERVLVPFFERAFLEHDRRVARAELAGRRTKRGTGAKRRSRKSKD